MTAATLVAFADTADWSSNVTPRSVDTSLTWLAGDFILVVGAAADDGTTLSVPTVTGLTFTLIPGMPVDTATTSETIVYAWGATAGAGGSGTIQGSRAGAQNSWGIAAFQFRGSAGVSGVGSAGGDTTKTVSLTRAAAESRVVYISADWSAAAPGTHTYTPGSSTERLAVGDGSNYGVYIVDWGDQGAAGSTTYGLATSPSTGTFNRAAFEILAGEAPPVPRPEPVPTFVAAGTIAEGTTAALTPGLPAGIAVGDMLLLLSVAKESSVTIPTPTGWTDLGSATGGTGAAAIDGGTLEAKAAYRVYQSGDAAPSVTVASATVAHHVIVGYHRSAADNQWDTPIATGGGDTTAAAAYSATGAADLDLRDNDLLLALTGNVTDAATTGTVTLAATGATIAANTLRVTDANTSGNDDRLVLAEAEVTAGDSSAAPSWTNTWTGTLATSSMGATLFVRLRELLPGPTRRWQSNYRR